MALHIGFSKKYFTLWDVSVSTEYGQNGRSWERVSYIYMQNLSFDEGEAIKKAKEKGCTNLIPDAELYGRNSSFDKIQNDNLKIDHSKFPKGKYNGLLIVENDDFDYMAWFFNEMYSEPETKELLKNRIEELTSEWTFVEKNYDNRPAFVKTSILEAEQAREKFNQELINGGEVEAIALKNISGYYPHTLLVEFENGIQQSIFINEETQPIKIMSYNGHDYGLPIDAKGKAKRIKNKNIKVTIKEEYVIDQGQNELVITSIQLIK